MSGARRVHELTAEDFGGLEPLTLFVNGRSHDLDGTETPSAIGRILGLPEAAAVYPIRWKLGVLVDGERRLRRGTGRRNRLYNILRHIIRLVRLHGAGGESQEV